MAPFTQAATQKNMPHNCQNVRVRSASATFIPAAGATCGAGVTEESAPSGRRPTSAGPPSERSQPPVRQLPGILPLSPDTLSANLFHPSKTAPVRA